MVRLGFIPIQSSSIIHALNHLGCQISAESIFQKYLSLSRFWTGLLAKRHLGWGLKEEEEALNKQIGEFQVKGIAWQRPCGWRRLKDDQ